MIICSSNSKSTAPMFACVLARLKGGGLLARGVEWLVGGLDCTLTLDIPLPSSLLYDDFALTVRVETERKMLLLDKH
jgi:hypothetical protein